MHQPCHPQRFLLTLVLLSTACVPVSCASTPPPADTSYSHVVLWGSTVSCRSDGTTSMVVLRERGVSEPRFNARSGLYETAGIVQQTEVFLVRWSDASFSKPVSIDKVCVLGDTRTLWDYTPIHCDQGDSVLVLDHPLEKEFLTRGGKLRLTSWGRVTTGFEKLGSIEVDEVLSLSRKGGKFIARNGPDMFIGDCRTLATLRSPSAALEGMLAPGRGRHALRLTGDGRFVVFPLSATSRDPLIVKLLDLDTQSISEFTVTPRDNWVDPAYAEIVEGELRVIIGYGRREPGFRENWTYEVLDSRGTSLGPLGVVGSLQTGGVLWDVERKRFLMWDIKRGSEPAVKVLGENGQSSSFIPKLPAELSSPSSP